MKLTELIAELQQFQEEYGDMPVEWEQTTEFIDGNRVILWRAAGAVDEYTLIQAHAPAMPTIEHEDRKWAGAVEYPDLTTGKWVVNET